MVHPLREYRQRHGLSQQKLAEFLGFNRQTILRWENHRRKPSLPQLRAISEKTGIPPRVLRPDLAEILGDAA